ncbi:MAG: hypothetical protein H6618_10200 [Deltaproteobacteria bacterium]|nr:hypothetical protein [Deltaproteobacteria bacterium]
MKNMKSIALIFLFISCGSDESVSSSDALVSDYESEISKCAEQNKIYDPFEKSCTQTKISCTDSSIEQNAEEADKISYHELKDDGYVLSQCGLIEDDENILDGWYEVIFYQQDSESVTYRSKAFKYVVDSDAEFDVGSDRTKSGSNDNEEISDSSKSLWSSEEILSTRQNCELSTPSELTISQAKIYCACVVEDASKRWEYPDFVSNEFSYSRQQVTDGVVEECSNSIGHVVWTDIQLQTTRNNCVNEASKSSGVSSLLAILYCGCIFDELSSRYSYWSYAANEAAINQQVTDDGTVDKCRNYAFGE